MLARLLRPRATVAVVFVVSMFMNTLDATIVNTALPGIARDLRVPTAGASAVISAYLVSLAVFVPASGWIADRFGDKRTLLTGLTIFTVASALCGAAATPAQLVASRMLQGVGGGMLTPVGMAMLLRAFAPHERARLAGLLIVPTAVAPALGPVIGGLLTDTLSWRWAFYVNVPVGAVTLAFGALRLRNRAEPRRRPFDLAGFLLAGGGLGCVTYALSEAPAQGWRAPQIVLAGVSGVACLSALAWHETRARAPMLDLRLLLDRLFRTATATLVLSTLAFLGSLYVFALLMQEGLGRSALTTGLLTGPEALGVMTCAQVVSRLYPTIGPRRLTVLGSLGIAAMCLCLATVDGRTPMAVIVAIMVTLGGSVSAMVVAVQTAAFARVPAIATGDASSLFNAARHTAGALGVALLATVIAVVGVPTSTPTGDLEAYHAAFLTASALALGAAALAARIRDVDAAATMRRPAPAPEPATS